MPPLNVFLARCYLVILWLSMLGMVSGKYGSPVIGWITLVFSFGFITAWAFENA